MRQGRIWFFFFSYPALEFLKGVWGSTPSVGKSHARNPTADPPRTVWITRRSTLNSNCTHTGLQN